MDFTPFHYNANFLRDVEQKEFGFTTFETYGDITVTDTLATTDVVAVVKNHVDPVVTVGYRVFLD